MGCKTFISTFLITPSGEHLANREHEGQVKSDIYGKVT
jgi:hypothetical protein